MAHHLRTRAPGGIPFRDKRPYGASPSPWRARWTFCRFAGVSDQPEGEPRVRPDSTPAAPEAHLPTLGGCRRNRGNVPLRLMAVSKDPQKATAGNPLSAVARVAAVGVVGGAIMAAMAVPVVAGF